MADGKAFGSRVIALDSVDVQPPRLFQRTHTHTHTCASFKYFPCFELYMLHPTASANENVQVAPVESKQRTSRDIAPRPSPNLKVRCMRTGCQEGAHDIQTPNVETGVSSSLQKQLKVPILTSEYGCGSFPSNLHSPALTVAQGLPQNRPASSPPGRSNTS